VKRQQLFHSFLPGFTVAVLTTQPAWATVVNMSEVQPGSYPNVLIGNSFTNNSLFPKSQFTSKSGLLLSSYFHKSMAKYTVNYSLPIMITDNNLDIQEVKILKKDDGRFVNFSDLSNHNFLAVNNPNPGQQFTRTDTRVSELLESSKCPQQKSQAALLLASNTCLPKKTSDWIAQTTTSTTSEPSKPFSVGNVKSQVSQSVDFTNTPNDLNPNPNPLLFPGQAEEVKIQATRPISLSEALELAKRNNNDLQVSLLQLQRTKSVLREAQAALFPSIDLSADVTNSRSTADTLAVERRRNAGFPADDAPANTNFSGTAQIKYDLYTSGRRNGAIQEAEERIRVQELDVEKQSEEIRLNVSKAYYDLQQADENVRITKSAVENAQASLKDAMALEKAGVGTRFDVLRSQVNLANSQQDLTNALSQQQIARRKLAPLLNLSQSVSISAADPVKLAGLWQQPLEQSIVLAYQNRPELQQTLAQRKIGEAQIKQALASSGPQVSLVGRYNLLDQFDDGTSVSDGYSLGLQASINLYNGGAAKARSSQAKTSIAIAETQFSEQKKPDSLSSRTSLFHPSIKFRERTNC